MADDSVLRYSLVLLGAVVLGIGMCTLSFTKMIATYVFGLLAISGLVLPDWEFFDRDFYQWLSPMPARDPSTPAYRPARFRIYPMRLVLFTTVYGFGLYKWWNFITN
ncbi:signal peptidase complex-like protein DTM1 isoform X4 [Magnolia sinica]|nr:signal peptidase complex-like protein DTM1 isoform X4 [Magnolia sinica]